MINFENFRAQMQEFMEVLSGDLFFLLFFEITSISKVQKNKLAKK